MAEVWPVTLPQAFLLEGYSDGMPDGRLKTKTDIGPGKVRPRTFAMSRFIRGDMYMTEDQLATMRTFIDTALIGGSLAFTFNDPVTNTAALVRFGDSLPAWIFTGTKYRVSLDLEILP